jgi:hypothetical protein
VVNAEVRTIPHGWPGTLATVRQIERLVNEGQTHVPLLETARALAASVPEGDTTALISEIHDYVQNHLKYTREAVETLSSIPYIFEQIGQRGFFVEDCDGAVVLWAALAKAVGIKTRFVLVSQRADRQANHIYLQAFDGQNWIGADPIVKTKPLGWEVERVTAKKYYVGGQLSEIGCAACPGNCSSRLGDVSAPSATRIVPTGPTADPRQALAKRAGRTELQEPMEEYTEEEPVEHYRELVDPCAKYRKAAGLTAFESAMRQAGIAGFCDSGLGQQIVGSISAGNFVAGAGTPTMSIPSIMDDIQKLMQAFTGTRPAPVLKADSVPLPTPAASNGKFPWGVAALIGFGLLLFGKGKRK